MLRHGHFGKAVDGLMAENWEDLGKISMILNYLLVFGNQWVLGIGIERLETHDLGSAILESKFIL